MFRSIKISTKITSLVIIIVLISVVSMSFIAFQLSRESIEERYLESISIIAKLKSQKIEAFFDRVKDNIRFGSKLEIVRDKIQETLNSRSNAVVTTKVKDTNIVNKKDTLKKQEVVKVKIDDKKVEKTETKPIKTNIDAELKKVLESIHTAYQISNIYLTDREGKIIFKSGGLNNSRKEAGDYFTNSDGVNISVGTEPVYYTNVYKVKNEYLLGAYTPIMDLNEKIIGILVYEINMNYVYNLSKDTDGLGQTGEIILAKKDGNKVFYLNPLRADSSAALRQYVSIGDKDVIYMEKSTKGIGSEGSGISRDYREKEVLATWRYIPEVDWGIVVKVDLEEVYAPTYRLAQIFLVAGFIIITISMIVGIIFSRVLITPLLALRETVNLLSQGVLPNEIEQTSRDEIGQMTNQLNDLVDNLKGTANFATKIGEGNFEADFTPSSENDTLGIALLTMRDSIQQSAKKDDELNWIVTGRAEIGDILREERDIQKLSEAVVEYVTNKIGAVQGAFYILNDEEEEDARLEITASYAYNKKKYLNGTFKFAEGLVGQAAVEQDTILRTEIPDDYVTITSGLLGDRKPKAILIRPLITLVDREEKVLGVLEFAGFEKFSTRNVKFVEEISEIIARTVFNNKVNERTKKLLEESREMGSNLQIQGEILRQNAEVMEATQEELKRTNIELKFQVERVQQANDKTKLLLQNASEVITIYEEDGTISYISPSVEKILGYTEDEMRGIKDIVYIHPEGREDFEQMFKDLIANPEEKITIQFSYFKKDGQRIWLESTGTNLLSDPAIEGILINKRDITEERRAEAEQRMKSEMQALSENSPDLITRFSKEGKIFYINPIIESYTGNRKEEYLSKNFNEVMLNPKILESWTSIWENIIQERKKVAIEMDFPSLLGDRIMQVNAIPEYNEQEALESVLLVSHDITERKLIELEIQTKNKQITESINYAKRIQEAILPNTSFLKRYLPQSFILYKPRDVVSGDFPWFMQKGDDIYIAAVDCTGHGVPGALISLIGFFLLNNIVKSQATENPGVILDQLDEAVTNTLKQNEENSVTRDGMDIALCKINLKTNTIEYAGAHRPMFYVTDSQLIEIKGNKFPIGGGQYKNRTNFTNTVIDIKPGDAAYMFSDGYPDQFGGPLMKKISPAKIKDVILQNMKLDLNQMSQILDQTFDEWKGNGKQTDDVLMIGMKF